MAGDAIAGGKGIAVAAASSLTTLELVAKIPLILGASKDDALTMLEESNGCGVFIGSNLSYAHQVAQLESFWIKSYSL